MILEKCNVRFCEWIPTLLTLKSMESTSNGDRKNIQIRSLPH
ncbi:hypothetical protein EV294_102573 [Paenibacillus sp. BK033]|nr:hypothetical protein [Paenibacillus sp. BK720]TCM99280.1 hypothetical protein EV294_102573 [Paenibacillus sp. BK033]